MLVRFTEDTETYNARYKSGDEVDVNPSVAISLIMKGKAEEVTDPSQKVLETLDNRKGRVLEMQRVSVSQIALERQLTPEQRAMENDPAARERLEAMQRESNNTLENDNTQTGAGVKNFEGQQVKLAANASEEDNPRDLNEEAKEAARKDLEKAGQDSPPEPEANTKPAATHKEGTTPRAPRSS